jgi:hypothetical protein
MNFALKDEPDADLNQAVDALMGAAYGSAGERCGDLGRCSNWQENCGRPNRAFDPESSSTEGRSRCRS